MTRKKYSSPLMKALLENTKWIFWRSDWSQRIIVEWDDRKVPIERIQAQIRVLVGEGFMYEPAINSEPIQFKVVGDARKASVNPL